MSHSVLNKKSYEAPSMLSNLVNSADAAWDTITRTVSINRTKPGEFRIPSPPPQKKTKVAGGGVGHSYKKSGQISRK